MLKYFSVENYKNFKEKIDIDFSDVGDFTHNTECINNGLLSKIMLFGKNGCGKTNLCTAMMDIGKTTFSLDVDEEVDILNVDLIEGECKFVYVLQFGEDVVRYEYHKTSNGNLVFEELTVNTNILFTVTNNAEVCYDGAFMELSDIIIHRFQETNTQDGALDSLNINRINSFFRWLANNIGFSINSPLTKMHEFIHGMRFVGDDLSSTRNYFIDSLAERKALKAFETFLNSMGVICELEVLCNVEGNYQLYFKRGRRMPFYDNASNGVKALADLYFTCVYLMKKNSFVFVDDFSASYHYDLAVKLVDYFKKEQPNCQFIFSTHNTNLMSNRLMRPDALYILSQEGKLTSLSKATNRELRECHNLEKMYIGGEFVNYE